MKLLVDPLLKPSLFNSFDVTRLGPEGQPVQGVENFLLLGKWLIELAVIGAYAARIATPARVSTTANFFILESSLNYERRNRTKVV
jgi:hypothetical protein